MENKKNYSLTELLKNITVWFSVSSIMVVVGLSIDFDIKFINSGLICDYDNIELIKWLIGMIVISLNLAAPIFLYNIIQQEFIKLEKNTSNYDNKILTSVKIISLVDYGIFTLFVWSIFCIDKNYFFSDIIYLGIMRFATVVAILKHHEQKELCVLYKIIFYSLALIHCIPMLIEGNNYTDYIFDLNLWFLIVFSYLFFNFFPSWMAFAVYSLCGSKLEIICCKYCCYIKNIFNSCMQTIIICYKQLIFEIRNQKISILLKNYFRNSLNNLLCLINKIGDFDLTLIITKLLSLLHKLLPIYVGLNKFSKLTIFAIGWGLFFLIMHCTERDIWWFEKSGQVKFEFSAEEYFDNKDDNMSLNFKGDLFIIEQKEVFQIDVKSLNDKSELINYFSDKYSNFNEVYNNKDLDAKIQCNFKDGEWQWFYKRKSSCLFFKKEDSKIELLDI